MRSPGRIVAAAGMYAALVGCSGATSQQVGTEASGEPLASQEGAPSVPEASGDVVVLTVQSDPDLRGSLANLVANSRAVIVGNITESESLGSTGRTGEEQYNRELTIGVDRVLAGQYQSSKVTLVDLDSYTLGGEIRPVRVSGVPRLEVGQHVVLAVSFGTGPNSPGYITSVLVESGQVVIPEDQDLQEDPIQAAAEGLSEAELVNRIEQLAG